MSKIDAKTWRQMMETARHGDEIFPLAVYEFHLKNLDYRVNMHWHKELEIIRLTEGEIIFGSSDGENLSIKAPALIFVPANKLHTLYLPRFCSEAAVVFDPRIIELSSFDEVLSEVLGFLSAGQCGIAVIHADDPGFDELYRTVGQIVELKAQGSRGSKLLIKAQLLSFIGRLYDLGLLKKERGGERSLPSRERHDRIKTVLTYLQEHYREPLNLDETAKAAGHSKTYLCRIFKKITGMKLSAYLNDYRLKMTVSDIIASDEEIWPIAKTHGFVSQCNFYKLFRDRFGMTPLQYRRSMRDELLKGQQQKVG